MSLVFHATERHKYAIELVGNHATVYRYEVGKHRHLYLGDCWIDVRAAYPRWFAQQHGLTAFPTTASSGEEAATLLIAEIEKFELPIHKGNPLSASTRKLLADIRQPRRSQLALTAGRSTGERVRGKCID